MYMDHNSLSYKNAFKVILTAELFSNHSFFIREKPVKKLAVRRPKLLRNLRAGIGANLETFGYTRFFYKKVVYKKVGLQRPKK